MQRLMRVKVIQLLVVVGRTSSGWICWWGDGVPANWTFAFHLTFHLIQAATVKQMITFRLGNVSKVQRQIAQLSLSDVC